MNFRYLLPALLAVLLSGACTGPKNKLEKCHKPQEYQQATVGPRIRVPADLEGLDDNARLQVPFGDTRTEPTPADQPCLVEPPDYNDRSPD